MAVIVRSLTRFCEIIWLISWLPVWSNFEIGDMDFWRSPIYSEYFKFLDEKGGFYYEVGRFDAVFRGLLDLTSRSLNLALGRCASTQYRGLSFLEY